jgi:hypothetical protein
MHLIFSIEKVVEISGDVCQGRSFDVILSVMCHFGGQLLTLEQLQMPNAKVTHQID